MKLIESSVQIIEEKDPYKMIELAGRTCYKSEDKITENSAEDDLFYYITTNMRVIVENNRLDDLQYQVEPTEHHEKRITAKFICDRGVSHEFVRHRVFSFAQESTRYCNYSKDKFNNEITFIQPSWNYF